jgi:hypothetical protein
MTVAAQNLQILDAIVAVVTVHVLKFERCRLVIPFYDPTLFALRFLESILDQLCP